MLHAAGRTIRVAFLIRQIPLCAAPCPLKWYRGTRERLLEDPVGRLPSQVKSAVAAGCGVLALPLARSLSTESEPIDGFDFLNEKLPIFNRSLGDIIGYLRLRFLPELPVIRLNCWPLCNPPKRTLRHSERGSGNVAAAVQ